MADVGRPTDYREEYCELVVELGRQGKSHAQISATIGQSRTTLYNWADQFPEFMNAMTRARELSQSWWEDQGQLGIWSKEFNPSAWAKSMSARFPDEYTDKTKTEHSGQIKMTHEQALQELE